jgi:hypothetical protein
MLANLDPNAIKQVNDVYKTISQDKWDKMGISKPQDLDIKPTDPPSIVFAKHQAQLYALNNEPKEGTPVFRENKSETMKAQEAKERRMAALNNAYHLGQIQFSHALSKADKQTQDLWIDDFVSDLPNKATGDITYHSEGKTISGKTIPLTPVLESALKVNGTTADFLIATPDGKFQIRALQKNNRRK